MKKKLLLAVLAMFGLEMQAQLVNSTMTMKKTEVVEVKETIDEKWGWNTFSFEYLALTMSAKSVTTADINYNDYYNGTASGFGFTYMRAISLTHNRRVPLYLEPGIGMEFYVGGKSTHNVKLLTAKVPLNLIYDISFPNSSIHIDPYLGLRFRANCYGTDEGYDWKKGRYSNDREVFSKDQMGGDGWAFTHFQVGWQVGCKFRFSKFYLQLGWGSDFNRLISKNKTSTSQFQSAIGVAF